MTKGILRLALAATVLVGATLANEEHADACGACYASLSESTVVNDHKMALAISPNSTILWDQITYSGNPKEFAYVVPVRAGARVEASRESWFAALDASTRPILMAPPSLSNYSGGGGDGDGCSPGCSDSSMALYDSAGSSNAGPPPVQVVAQSVVGPYETVTLRSEDPEALQKWLVAHEFAVPETSTPIIAEYVAAKFDFIALRLRPGKDARAMKPIRIVSPGADLTLPLRMMQIGAASSLGITLFVISEGRYRTKSFPTAEIDFTKLIWDTSQSRTNYQELSLAAMATNQGRSFLTEYADRIDSTASAAASSGMTGNPLLEDAYQTACASEDVQRSTDDAEPDAGAPAQDAPDGGDTDGGTLDADAGGAANDAGSGESPGTSRPPRSCDDLETALAGMVRRDQVWVTRMRANLPFAALADTLVLEPNPQQVRFDNIHTATDVGTISSARIAPRGPTRRYGTYATVALTVFAVSRVLRRRRR